MNGTKMETILNKKTFDAYEDSDQNVYRLNIKATQQILCQLQFLLKLMQLETLVLQYRDTVMNPSVIIITPCLNTIQQ